MTDERKGLASCSDLAALKLCPGKQSACKDVPEQPPGPDAERGTRIHAAMAGLDVELTGDELECVAELNRLLVSVCEQTMGGDLTTLTEIVREKRLWYPKPPFSGQADFVGVKTNNNETTALIVDYKTGRNPVDKAEANLQLRGLAALLWANRDVDVVYAAIIQPYASPQTTIVRYDAVDLSTAAGEVAEIVGNAYKPDAPRNPGEYQCRYCRARATGKCPESAGTLTQFVDPSPIVLSPSLLDRCAMAEKVIESIREAAKRALEADPNAIPGWKLKPGVVRETINDPDRVYQRCLELKMDHPAFMRAVEVKKGKLKDAIRESTGLKGKTLDATLQTVLDGCVEQKQTAPSLARDE